MAKLSFIYNGISSNSLGIVIKSMPLDILSEKRIEKISFPNINGSVYRDDDIYESYPLDLECTLLRTATIENINQIKKLFRSRTGELILSRKPNHILKVRILSTISFERFITNNSSSFLLSFEVQPFSYLKSGKDWTVISNGSKIKNPGNYYSEPLYKITGAISSCGITINGKEIKFAKVTKDFIVDVEAEDVYSLDKKENLNNFMNINSDFIGLQEGENIITYTGINKLEILPNWREL